MLAVRGDQTATGREHEKRAQPLTARTAWYRELRGKPCTARQLIQLYRLSADLAGRAYTRRPCPNRPRFEMVPGNSSLTTFPFSALQMTLSFQGVNLYLEQAELECYSELEIVNPGTAVAWGHY